MGIEDKQESYGIKGIEETLEQIEIDLLPMDDEEEDNQTLYSSLSGHVKAKFQEFKDAKFNSGIETQVVNSHRAFNSEYEPKILSQIKEDGGSEIYMGITNMKCRALASWIRDILMNPDLDSFMIEPTPIQDLPDDLKAQLTKEVEAEINRRKEQMATAQATTQPQGQGQQQQLPGMEQPAPSKMQEAERTLRDVNKMRRDVSDAVYQEIREEGLFQIKQIERIVKDQLIEGGWENALNEFIGDFSVYPSAIMKGPVVQKNKKLTWSKGEAVVSDELIFANKRVSALDFYPSPNATTVNDGDMIEHMRFSKSDIQAMKGLPHYNSEMINDVLEDPVSSWYNITNIEDDKADIEKRGTEHEMNQDVIHGMHFFGKIEGSILRDWGIEETSKLEVPLDGYTQYEVEVLLVGPEVIKCQINDDPLSRRPYHKASFCNIPGAFWGISLPTILDDTQRMCNAAARALSDNMGLASGPQAMVYIDRLADDGDIEDIRPRKIWQMMSDKTGGGGKALDFFTVPSQANELMAVLEKFEQKADDVSGIPKYAHAGGTGSTKGAASTAQGLSMLMESASKSIKDAIRNIDNGLIVPRVEHQFYYNLVKKPELNYTGDVNIRAMGSAALTIKGSQQLRRNEFLQHITNPQAFSVVGMEGYAEVLRVMADDLGLGKNVVPDNLTLKRKQEEQQKAAQEAAEKEGSEKQVGLQATQLQVQAQTQMHQMTQETKRIEIDNKKMFDDIMSRIKVMEIEQRGAGDAAKSAAKEQDTKIKEANANAREKAKLEANQGR